MGRSVHASVRYADQARSRSLKRTQERSNERLFAKPKQSPFALKAEASLCPGLIGYNLGLGNFRTVTADIRVQHQPTAACHLNTVQ